MNRRFYLAAKEGAGFEVKTLEEMDARLAEGFTIIDASDETETVLATPEAGWIKPKPEPVNSKKCVAKAAGADDVAAAFNILVYGEEAEHGNTDAGA